jgi:hypothetical protein
MAPEPEPGKGSSGGAKNFASGVASGLGATASIRAGFSVDIKSLKDMNAEWTKAIGLVKQYNAEMTKVSGPMGSGGGGGGSRRNAGRGGGGGAGASAGRNGGDSEFSGGDGIGKPKGGNGGESQFSTHKFGRDVAGGALALSAYGASQIPNWQSTQVMSQQFALQAGSGPGSMQAIRQGMVNLGGYASSADLQQGLGYINSAQPINWYSQNSQNLLRSVGAYANMPGGSFTGAAQQITPFYSPQQFYSLRNYGINTVGAGGALANPGQIAQQLLGKWSAPMGGNYTASQVNASMAQGQSLNYDLSQAGLSSQQQQFVSTYGQVTSAMAKRAGVGASSINYQQVQSLLADPNKAKTVLGGTLYDSIKQQQQAATQTSNTVANSALGDLTTAVNVTTKAFQVMNGALGIPGVGGAVGGVAGIGGYAGGRLMNTATGLGGSAVGQYMMAKMMMNKIGGGAVGAAEGASPMFGALGGARSLFGAAGLAIGGTIVGSKIRGSGKSALRSTLGGAATGATYGGALGMLGGPLSGLSVPVGAAIGGVLGGVGGFLERGALNDGSSGFGMSEIDALSSAFSGGSPMVGMGMSLASNPGPAGGAVAAGQTQTAGGTPGGAIGPVGGRASSALAWMLGQSKNPSQSWLNKCLTDVRESLGVAAKYGSAALAWGHTKFRHSGTPPAGVPVWWGGGDGHVALSAGGGKIWSSDIQRRGMIDLVDMGLVSQKWGKPYLGWSEDINDVRVWQGAVPAAMSAKAAGPAASASAGSAGKLAVASGGSNAAQITNFFRAKGLSAAQIAGILGNLQQESGINPNSAGGGLAQWQGSRWTALNSYANKMGGSVSSLAVQLGYLWSELHGSEAGAFQKFLSNSSTAGAAATSWSQYVERPGKPMLSNRVKYANQFAAKGYKDGAYDVQGTQLALIHHGEMVIPSAAANSLRSYISAANAGGSGTTTAGAMSGKRMVQVVINAPITMASGNTPADAQNFLTTVTRAMASDQRIASVMAGDN